METVLKILLAHFFKFFAKISPDLTAKIAWLFFCKPRIRNKPHSEIEEKLLQQAEQYFINSGEYKISVYAWKNIKNITTEKTILLTHGWGGHALNFSQIIQRLITDGFNVVAYDSPAHARSSGKQTNLLHNTQALLSVAEHTGPICALLGHSFGTMANAYALELTHHSAQLSAVEKIVLVAGPNKLIDIFTSFAQAMQLPDSVLNIFYQKLETIAKRKIESMSTSEFLRSYKGETLIIHDRKDRVVPYSEAIYVANNTTASLLFPTTGNGHFRILAAHQVIDKIVNFLSN